MVPPASDTTQQRTSRFAIRNLFSRQKSMNLKALKGAEGQMPTPEGVSSLSNDHQCRAGPKYAPMTSGSREVAAQSPCTGTLQAVAVATKERGSRRRTNARDGARLLFKIKQSDALKDTRDEIRQTGQIIRKKEWAPRTITSSLNIASMIRMSAISEETKQLLKGVVEDLQQFKREQEEKQIREQEKEEEVAEIEEVMEVVTTKVVRNGSAVSHVKILRPHAMLEVGTLDPRARRPAPMNITDGSARARVSSSCGAAGSQMAETEPSSTISMISRSIMERGYPFQRSSRIGLGVWQCKPSEKKRKSVSDSSNRVKFDSA